MHLTQAKILLPAASILEFLGVLTLITNEGMLIPKVDIGFSIPVFLPVEAQGIGLMVIGCSTTVYAVKNMQ